jgi:asparagine synthase (glutamine-hydrolysing)
MAGLALVADFQSPRAEADAVMPLLAAMPHRGPDGCATAVMGGCAIGVAKQITTRRPDHNPFLDLNRKLLVAADLQLDNRDELGRELLGNNDQLISDLELVALGYERWGLELASHLLGDFSLIIWDSNHRRVYAARNPLGTRPLFYRRFDNQIRMASEAEALLAPGLMPEIEDQVVLAYLVHRYQHYRQTFFREIFRVLPGHYLVADARGISEVCYWRPPAQKLGLLSERECLEEFRRLFRLSVQARLDSPKAIVIQLSGGLDSSSIACIADEICADNPAEWPSIVLGSGIFPGFDCDETKYIQAIANSVRLRSERWDATQAIWPSGKDEPLSHPWRDPGSGSYGSFALARSLGGRVVLSGEGGDQLLLEDGVFTDLARHHEWGQLVRETLLARGLSARISRRFSLFSSALRPLIARPALRRLYRRVRPRRPQVAPFWLSENLRNRFSEDRAEPSPFESNSVSWHSAAQQTTWRWLTSAELIWSREVLEHKAARAGIELRFPYLDRRLVTFVLSLPFERRIPSGYWKRILREAMADRLPPLVAERTGFTTFDSTGCDKFSQVLTRVQSVLSEGPWVAEPYVVQYQANELLRRLQSGNGPANNWRECLRVWNIAMLERWLRHVHQSRAPEFDRRRGDGEAESRTSFQNQHGHTELSRDTSPAPLHPAPHRASGKLT